MNIWNNAVLDKNNIFINAAFVDLIEIKSKLKQNGIFVMTNFCNPEIETKSDIENRCYEFGSNFGHFLEGMPYFYDVFDRGKETYTVSTRYSDTNLSHGFHTDGTKKDNFPRYVMLCCLEDAAEGGINLFVNALAVKEIIQQRYPDVMGILQTDIIRDVKIDGIVDCDLILKNAYPIYSFNNHDQNWTFRYMRRWINIAYQKLHREVPLDIKNALDVLDKTMQDSSLIFENKLNKGDMVFFDNHFLAHDRTAFKDHIGRKRHILRGWIYK